MQHTGKLLGLLFGSLMGNPVTALIGLYIGYRFDKARELNSAGFKTSHLGGDPSQQERQDTFFTTAFSVMGHVAKAKGQVKKEEIQAATIFMDRMQLNAEQRQSAQQAFRQGKASDFPLQQTLRKARLACGNNQSLLQFFLEIQLTVVLADGEIHPNERRLLVIIAQELGFSRQRLEAQLAIQEAVLRFKQSAFNAKNHYQQQNSYSQRNTHENRNEAKQLKNAYSILEVTEHSSDKDIKRAYRKKMNEHHPDKLAAKGLPPEMMSLAKEKAQEIQNAYEWIKKERGFK